MYLIKNNNDGNAGFVLDATNLVKAYPEALEKLGYSLSYGPGEGPELKPDEPARATVLQSYEDLLNYVSTKHHQNHADISECHWCVLLGEAAENIKALQKPIVVTVSGGAVQQVSGIPAGVFVHVHDYDTDGQIPLSPDDFRTKYIRTDDNGDNYFLGVFAN